MPKCLECGETLTEMNHEHLGLCCGLTMQEYAIRHCLSLDMLVPERLINTPLDISDYPNIPAQPSRRALLILSAIKAVGQLRTSGEFVEMPGEVRRLEQLFWYLQQLNVYQFKFCQEYIFNDKTHRVAAQNCLRTHALNIDETGIISVDTISPIELLLYTAVAVSLNSFMCAGYLFIRFADAEQGQLLSESLQKEFKINLKVLDTLDSEGGILLRTHNEYDANGFTNLLRHRLEEIPCTMECFSLTTPEAAVTKELHFDSAHFITDHPGACANMHGGRYNLSVTISDHINPHTGFVMDYGYLKTVVKNRVIERLDHANLNLVDTSLSWRSSTELLSIFIWEHIIDYIPSLEEINIYETDTSYCTFCGPSLEEWQINGCRILDSHFNNPQLGCSILRRQSGVSSCPVKLTSVSDKKKA